MDIVPTLDAIAAIADPAERLSALQSLPPPTSYGVMRARRALHEATAHELRHAASSNTRERNTAEPASSDASS